MRNVKIWRYSAVSASKSDDDFAFTSRMARMKMQVAFDAAYVHYDLLLEKKHENRDSKRNELIRAILDVKAKSSSDFEALTALYRQIFTFLMSTSGSGSTTDRNVEREIAAALESVFPRIGLKSFIQLSTADKKNQLNELCNIVLGIRLFNKEIKKGGAGLSDNCGAADADITRVNEGLNAELDQVSELCQQYSDALLYLFSNEGHGWSKEATDRLKLELANRRQYHSYLQSLLESLTSVTDKISMSRTTFAREMEDLKMLVGSRTSVPKEQVYPKFDGLAMMYNALSDEMDTVRAREQTWFELQKLKASYEPTLSHEIVQRARVAPPPPDLEPEEGAAGAPP